jgi:anaerobic selenocysteine-containing dehydrogenase
MWRDQPMMLHLQRGEPLVLLNPEDARRKGIRDHDLVRVYNDIDSFVVHSKLTGAVRPGQAHIFHAWEPYQFRTGTTHQDLAPSPFKVTQLVGDYGHLHDRDTRVDVELLSEQS